MRQGRNWHRVMGFTLVELLTTIAIIGILAGIAIPAMQGYMLRARYSELVTASTPYRKAIDLCYQLTSNLNNCTAGQNGVPSNMMTPTGAVAYIFTLTGGQIFVFPNSTNGFNLLTDYYTLTPRIANQTLVWTFGGPGMKYI